MLGEKPKPLNKDQAERDVHLKNAGANLSKDYFIREYGLLDGDLVDQAQTGFNQFTALPRQAFNFKASANKLSPEQQEVEELTDGQGELQLLKPDQVKELVFKSNSPESLAYNLMQLIPDATQTQFTANLDQALYAADVLGYVTAQGGK